MTGRPGWVTWAGLTVVGAAAAIMSFTALADLAWLCGITTIMDVPGDLPDVKVAWLLPVTVDVLAAVATRVWLQRRVNAEAIEFARWSAWSAIGTTVVGNATHGFLVGGRLWVLAVIVSAVPAVALGVLNHLGVLVGRGSDRADDELPLDPFGRLYLLLATAEWEAQAVRESAPADRPRPTLLTRDNTNDELAADLRSETRWLGREFTRDEVVDRYGVGGPRAKTLRDLAQQPPVPTAVGQSTNGSARKS